MKSKYIFSLFVFYVILSGTTVMGQLLWHTPLAELNTESKLIVEGKIISGSQKAEEEGHSSIEIQVEKDFRNKNAKTPGVITVYFHPGDDLAAYTPGVHAIFFLTLTNSRYLVFDRAFGVTVLSSNRSERAKAVELFDRHLQYVNSESRDCAELRRIVLVELNTKPLFDLGFATIYYAMDSEKGFEQFSSKEQVKLLDAFKSTPLWANKWLNLMLIYNKVPNKSSKCIKYILARSEKEKDEPGPFNEPLFSTKGYFSSLCVVDASVQADLGTGIKSNSPTTNLHNWNSLEEEQQLKVVNQFFETINKYKGPFK